MTKSGPRFPVIEPGIPHPEEVLCDEPGPFRPNVAAIILHADAARRQVLMGERNDMPGRWQWPQGGLDPGETPEQGLRREIFEEIGVASDAVHIHYRFPFLLRYRFPQRLGKKFAPRQGQEQHYFIVTLSAEPDLAKATDEEFHQLRWLPLEEAVVGAVWFKREVYRAAVDHAHEIIPTLKL
jgi:putative (di)nucleoside polyphosphate hydrolase